jgi:hypothetical protein
MRRQTRRLHSAMSVNAEFIHARHQRSARQAQETHEGLAFGSDHSFFLMLRLRPILGLTAIRRQSQMESNDVTR